MKDSLRSLVTRFCTSSIRRQLILGIALVHAVLMTLFVLDLVNRERHFLHEQSIAQAAGLAKTLASSSTSWVLANDIAGLDEVLQSQSSFPDLRYAMVVSPRGKVIAHTDKSKNGLYFSDALSRSLLDSEAQAQTLLANDMLVDVAYPILVEDELIGWARVGIGQEKIAAGLGEITFNGIIYTLLAIVIGSIFAYFMARSLTGGLRHLLGVIEGNRLGKRGLRADLQRQDEIGLLGRDFNQMLDALAEQEKDIREREENLAVTLNSIGDAVITTDIDGKVVNMNPVAEQLTGWTLAEARNQPLDRVFHIINSQNRETVSNPVQQVLKSGNIVGLANHTVLIARTGKEYQIADSAAPIRNRLAQITGVVLVFHDVTEQYRQQALLAAHEAEMKRIFDVLPAPVARVDKEGRYLFVSAAYERWFGKRSEDVIGRTQRDSVSAALYEKVSPYFKRALAGEKVNFEAAINTPSGKVLYGQVTALPDYDSTGTVCGFFIIVADITERKQAEQTAQVLRDQLIQATKMEAVGHLTAGIAHDFNNILGAILGYTELSKHVIAAGTPEVGERYMDEILKAIQRAKELIAQMLTFSRLSPDTKGVAAPATLLTPVVKEVVSLLRSSIPSTIELNYRVENPDLKAHILPIHLHQIILNLGINARDAIGEYGKIDITLASQHVTPQVCSSCQLQYEGEFVKLTIHDTGSGIAEHNLKNIFNPFFTTKGVGKGTGMGLSVVHGLVHALGGHIRVESEPGKGTALSILLPLAVSEAAADVYTAMPETSAGTLAGIRIMVVDDEAAMTAILHEFLSLHGARITAYNSPLLAWHAFEQQPQGVDLVITDETMPGLSGMHLAQRMLKLRPELPVILCTGYSAHATPELAEQAGLAGFFHKPLQMSELLQKLRKICLARGIGQLRKPEQ